ncbi:MAG: DNA double-strand break repair nuclease NurA [Vicinamibacteria bacterium]
MPRIFVEAWDPEYGSSFAPGELTPSLAEVDPSVEVPAESWKPIPPAREALAAERLAFIDGVRRVDALVWIEDGSGATQKGICASYAAGMVKIERRAEINEIQVRRRLLTAFSSAAPLETDAGIYAAEPVSGESLAQLFSSLQDRLRLLEIEVAGSERSLDLVVIDGPLSSHHAREGVVGYIKSHHVSYLEPALERVVGMLSSFERTPLFLTTTSYPRYSTYLGLGGDRSHPFSGVVRLEFSAELPLGDVKRLASLAARTLPRYASVPHKDPRAPQNLFPIGALERELRRRLGDHGIVHRALRSAAASSG